MKAQETYTDNLLMSIESNEINDIFYKMLEDSMLRYKINQRGLAEKLSKNPSMISRWLKGEAKPHLGTVNEIARQLNYKLTEVNDKWILSRNENEVDSNNYNKSVSALLEKVEEVLLEMVENATPEERSVISKCAIKLQSELTKWALENQIPKPE